MEKKFEIKGRDFDKVVKREINESENIFMSCMSCERAYKRTEKYPYEVCNVCTMEGIKLEEVIKK